MERRCGARDGLGQLGEDFVQEGGVVEGEELDEGVDCYRRRRWRGRGLAGSLVYEGVLKGGKMGERWKKRKTYVIQMRSPTLESGRE